MRNLNGLCGIVLGIRDTEMGNYHAWCKGFEIFDGAVRYGGSLEPKTKRTFALSLGK